jgi:hypothetical protein
VSKICVGCRFSEDLLSCHQRDWGFESSGSSNQAWLWLLRRGYVKCKLLADRLRCSSCGCSIRRSRLGGLDPPTPPILTAIALAQPRR